MSVECGLQGSAMRDSGGATQRRRALQREVYAAPSNLNRFLQEGFWGAPTGQLPFRFLLSELSNVAR